MRLGKSLIVIFTRAAREVADNNSCDHLLKRLDALALKLRPGFTDPGILNFSRWSLVFVGSVYGTVSGTGFVSPFRRLEC
jgi:hypothetical protein